MVVIWNTSCENTSFELETLSQCFIFHCNYISFQDMPSFFEFLVSVINHHINGLHLFLRVFNDFVFQISCDAKYFSSLVQGIVIKDLYLISYTIFKSETKKNTLLVVELLAVSWVPCISRHYTINMEQLTKVPRLFKFFECRSSIW